MLTTPVLLTLAACSDYKFTPQNDISGGDSSLGAPLLELRPRDIDLGVLAPLSEPQSRVITASNLGDRPLAIHQARLDEGHYDLSWTGQPQLEPGESTELVVTFDPVDEGSFPDSLWLESDDPTEPLAEVLLDAEVAGPRLTLEPVSYDFGLLEQGEQEALALEIGNRGTASLEVTDLQYSSSGDLRLSLIEAGPPPWSLLPGETTQVWVELQAETPGVSTGLLTVSSSDPQSPVAQAEQRAEVLDFEGFSTGWYVLDDGVAYETTSSSDHRIESHGDTDLYWYEPSGVHGLMESADPQADFAIMRQYVLDRVPKPVEVSGPFSYDASSSLSTFEYATFTYFMCDFYLDKGDDPSLYSLSIGAVDDGVQVMVNGHILGHLVLGQSGSFSLEHARLGELNTLIVILADDSASNKYVRELGFYRDGVLVKG